MRVSPRRSPANKKPASATKKTVAIGAACAVVVTAVPAAAQMSSDLSSQLSSGRGLSDLVRPADPPQRPTLKEQENPKIEGLPKDVSVQRIKWITQRRVALDINSAAMPGKPIRVEVLLARDWGQNPNATFPEVWALDGLRARDDENGWTIETNIEQFYADKNVNVVLPVGGESSFYSDWQKADNGKHYMWETFLTKELIPIMTNQFRSNGKRAVVGLSMGGTAAMNLAQRNPHLFEFVGSFSGYLDTTTTGMPMAIKAAMRDAGGYDAEAMWGPMGSQDWVEHDPKLGIANLKGKTVYVSAGSGTDDFGKPGSVATGPAVPAGVGLEVISRMSTQTFEGYAKRAGIPITTVYRPSGVHAWPYWQYEMTQAWPKMADALGVAKEDRGAQCAPIGAIAEATKAGQIGSCVNNEYDVADGRGKAQDFRNGAAFWSPETGAQVLFGAILATYNGNGAANGWLGFPLTGEQKTPDGKGRFAHFQNGSIYWTPETGAVPIPADMVKAWGTAKFEAGPLGYPVEDAIPVRNGFVQKFQGGYVARNEQNQAFVVYGEIGRKYGEMKTAHSELGFPKSNERLIKGGAFQEFEHGNIYWSPQTGAKFIKFGATFEEWGKNGWEQGRFGWPTSDMRAIPGGTTIDFQHGGYNEVAGIVREKGR
ncbi:alpha/beta hydrolase-fold protein [Corynebacterium aquatimens]|uniref:S-formylglutathione hydrolase FrmB n=1 Tax=Corynebacterium aquatimens TaxID=1190508 RepID=A0A931GXZ0_9CORY|nr:alpha/beta hydrolase-fold protein [Corynebacterium aquatimens]MBG6122849.1 S-formylglutathione hydrolase FrmB [Corynebacterium aquatimens]WJY66816.1 Diacylglycerol acyltransferase/mycolyltransferase Ag85C precursor [Corynebacterium aquatimens]